MEHARRASVPGFCQKEKTSLKSQHKKEIREKRLDNLATRLKSNILKRKKSMLKNKNG